MRKRKNHLLPILVILLLGLGLGYALLSQDLTINGTTKVKGNNWDIHFNNVVINSDSVALSTGDSAASIDSNDNTLVNYTITLNQPGDFYEFTVDAVNAGTVDGMIGEVINKLNGVVISPTNPLPSYLNYSFSYADDTAVAPNHLLEAGHTETYKIRVEFKRDIENSELPTTDQTNTFSFGVAYLQRTSMAIAVPHPEPNAVYTANYSTDLYVGQSIPNNITQYETAAEAMAALSSIFGEDTPFYLKHIMDEDIVSESYVGLTITPEMANNNAGVHAGTYALRGIRTYYYSGMNKICYPEYLDSTTNTCKSPYYENNVSILNTAFGESNCEEIAYDSMIGYRCSITNLIASTTDSGYAIVGNDGGCFCQVEDVSKCNCD